MTTNEGPPRGTPPNGERGVPIDPVASYLYRVIKVILGYLDTRPSEEDRKIVKQYLMAVGTLPDLYRAAMSRHHLNQPMPLGLRERLTPRARRGAPATAPSVAVGAGSDHDMEKASDGREVTLLREQVAALQSANKELEQAGREKDGRIADLERRNAGLEEQLRPERAAVTTLNELREVTAEAPSEDDVAERRELDTKERERMWTHTITRVGVSRGVRSLRLDVDREVLPAITFAEERLFMNPGQLGHIENGQLPTRLTLEQIREGSLLKDFGYDSKPMQLLRVLSDVKGPRKVFDKQDIETVKFGDFIRYFRIALGHSQGQAAGIFTEANVELLGKEKAFLRASEITTKSKFSNLERGIYDGSVDYKNRYLERVFHWLQLAEDDPLREIFFRKANNLPVELDEATYQRIVAGRFLFDNPSYKDPPMEIFKRDSDFITAIEQQRSEGVGSAVRMLRNASGKRQVDVFAEVGTFRPTTYSALETGSSKSLDQTLVEVLYGLDRAYTINHPLVQLLLEIADEERKGQNPTVEKEIIEAVCDLGFTHRRHSRRGEE